MTRAGFVLGLLVMVQGAVGQTPKIYWSDPTNSPKILRSNLDGSDVEEVIVGGIGALAPTHMAIDRIGGKIYWIDDPTGTALDKIQRANLDGSDIEDVLVINSVANAKGIAIDSIARKLYWTSKNGAIYRSDLNGSNIEEVIDQISPVGILIDYPSLSLCQGDVPTISGIGLLVMVAGMIAAGGFVLRRRGALR